MNEVSHKLSKLGTQDVDLRSRVDADGRRDGKVIPYKMSELRWGGGRML
jgi:hypothetical protein